MPQVDQIFQLWNNHRKIKPAMWNGKSYIKESSNIIEKLKVFIHFPGILL